MLDRHAESIPHISITPDTVGVSGVTVSAVGGPGEPRWILGRPIIPAANECLRTAALALKVKLTMTDSLDRMLVEFPIMPANQPGQ
jgi:hypothetical protein